MIDFARPEPSNGKDKNSGSLLARIEGDIWKWIGKNRRLASMIGLSVVINFMGFSLYWDYKFNKMEEQILELKTERDAIKLKLETALERKEKFEAESE